ncbi:hypothetical protein ACT8ZV_19150 [Nocardioides sp. MAHUQ-72]|uniref:hypothetical protein n=1 Tax=unclassified Nocardioides TaxID=2615069 RepID=UPI00360710B2
MSEAGGPGPGDPTSGEHVGSVAEEAMKLFGALSDWARDHGGDLGQGVGGLVDQAVAAAHDVDEHIATGAPECTYCPICRAVHVVRQTSPEVRAHLATAASSLLQAAAGMLATTVPDRGRDNDAGVERIDLDDDTDGAWPEEDDE